MTNTPLPHLERFLDRFLVLTEPDKEALRAIATVRELAKGDLLQQIGQACRTVYFMHRGIARIFYYKDGLDITEAFAFEGQLAVRFESLFTGLPSQKGIQMLEDAAIVALPAAGLEKLYTVHPAIERLFRRVFEASHVETLQRIESIQFHTAAERYRRLLEEKPDLLLRVPLKYVASYLGITPVSLSRIRGAQ